jgi:antitoxin component YwqK of YwqJK toxin-antitoxin module
MTIREYINSLEFETVKFYHKKRDLNSIRVFRNGQSHYFEEFSSEASNIINMKEFEEVLSSNASSRLKSRFKESMYEYQNSSRHHEILSVIQFYKNSLVQGQINCNFYEVNL